MITSKNSLWYVQAENAGQSIVQRHIQTLLPIPYTCIATATWPKQYSLFKGKMTEKWHYWWQAHLLDCLLDAHERSRSNLIPYQKYAKGLIRGIKLFNNGSVVNGYYDDMAWLGLALQRSRTILGANHKRDIDRLSKQFKNAWRPDLGGGIRWRKEDVFFNAPAGAPIGMFWARKGNIEKAEEISDYLTEYLLDEKTGLIIDGIRPDFGETNPKKFTKVTDIYTYNQGVMLGLWTELAIRTKIRKYYQLIGNLIESIDKELTSEQVLQSHGTGDGGLFTGILARYLAFVATELPSISPTDGATKKLAKKIVTTTAKAVVVSSAIEEGGLHFPTQWLPIDQQTTKCHTENPDLSIQLSGWMLCEAAWRVGSDNTQ